MTDREQIRREAEEVIFHGSHVHEDLPADVAAHCLTLLAELEQAERERDEERKGVVGTFEPVSYGDLSRQLHAAGERERKLEARLAQFARERDEANRMFQTSCNDVTRQAARLAQAEKLAEALRSISAYINQRTTTASMAAWVETAREALADWERKGVTT